MKFLIVIALALAAAEAKKLDCNFPCVLMYKPVCGHDGVTYGNECQLRGAACEKGEAITIVSKGECKETCSKVCTKEYNPQCGHDGIVYANPCLLRSAACESKQAIAVVEQGTDSNRCGKCQIPCTREYSPVCGSDGKTYPTECVMRSLSCKQKKAIMAVYQGECRFH